jgi:hypothetical protein
MRSFSKMRVTNKPHVDSSKRDRQRDTSAFAKGGKGAPNKMLREVPAEPAPRGRTGPAQAKAPGAKAARGGPKIRADIGGASRPARPGSTGT